MLKISNCKREVLYSLVVVITLAHTACSSSSALVDDAVKKLRAARYYYAQEDYPNARTSSTKALYLWKTIGELKLKSYPDWVVKHNIRECEDLLASLPASQPLEAPTVVPIRMISGIILVDAVLNQKENATLILDTGSDVTILTPETAQLAHIDTTTNVQQHKVNLVGGKTIEIPFAVLPEIKIGEAVVKNLKIGISSVALDRPHVGGLLGADFLNHFKIAIDRGTGKLRLAGR